MAINTLASDTRRPENIIDPLLLSRYSPRALSGEAITAEELFSLFEAAKWAPSAFNEQPWRFIYAFNDSPAWDKLFSTLAEPNKIWVDNAAVLVLIISKKTFSYNGQENRTASFDAGAAWENLALEAASRGLIAHAMSGFDYDLVRKNLNIPADYSPEAMIAIGRLGNKENLPEKFQAGEIPTDRKKLAEIISRDEFNF